MFLLNILTEFSQKMIGEAVNLLDTSLAVISKMLAVDFYVVSSVLNETGRLGMNALNGLWSLALFLHHTVHDFASFIWDLIDIIYRCHIFITGALEQLIAILTGCCLTIVTGVVTILSMIRFGGLAVWYIFYDTFQHIRYVIMLIVRALELTVAAIVYVLALIPSTVSTVMLSPVFLAESGGRQLLELAHSLMNDGWRFVGSVAGSVLSVPTDAYLGLVFAALVTFLCRRYQLHQSLGSLLEERCRVELARCRTGWLAVTELIGRMLETRLRIRRFLVGVRNEIFLKMVVAAAYLGHLVQLVKLRFRMSVADFRLQLRNAMAARQRRVLDQRQRQPIVRRNNPPAGRYVAETSSSDEDEAEVKPEVNDLPGAERLIRELQERLVQAQENALCIVCQDRDKSIVLLPCRHFCMCQGCALRVRGAAGDSLCPVCRRDIDDLMPVFS